MTDLKRRLSALDRLETPDMWDRAQTLDPPTHLDRTPEHAARNRLVVIAVAFAVFAAAATFAWRGFNGTSPRPAEPADTVSSTVLWPERTESALLAAQAAADTGDPVTAWRTDPVQVATHFAEDVLGWGPAGVNYQVTTQDGTAPGSVEASIVRFAFALSGARTGFPATCPPPFDDEVLRLGQPAWTGPGGVWSVTDVRAPDLHLDLQLGDQIPNGSSLAANVTFPDTAAAIPTFSAMGGIHVGASEACSMASGKSLVPPGGSIGPAPVATDSGLGHDCGPTPGGYVWIETASRWPVVDPLIAPTADRMFYALTLVPVQVHSTENGSAG